MDQHHHHYTPVCDVEGCAQPASHKIAAPWSDGPLRELKNYGVACLEHADLLLDRAVRKREALRLSPGETLGDVQLYELVEGLRDAELTPVDLAAV